MLAFEPSLFNTPQFLALQAAEGWLSFFVIDENRQRAVAAIHLHLDNQTARSPLRAPYGSLEFCDTVRPQVVYDFVEYVVRRLRDHGAREIWIKHPPRAYAPASLSLVETFLINQQFTVDNAEPGAVIAVDASGFESGLQHSELLRRRQVERAGFEFRMVGEDSADDVFGFIASCNEEKGYKTSISIDNLRATVLAFPGRYLFSVVTENGNLTAAAISVRVKKQILYNFMMNHEKRYNQFSPPILLLEGLYRYCQANQIALFDLGTSALNGRPNFSLFDFKMRMGAVPTSKFSFYKQVD